MTDLSVKTAYTDSQCTARQSKANALQETNRGSDSLEQLMPVLQQSFEKWAGRAMPDDVRQRLMEIATVEHWEKDQQMIALGELPEKLYFICKGLCRSYYLDQNGNDVTRFFILEGDWCLTEIQILAEPSELCVETLETCDFLVFRIADMARFHDSDFLKDAYICALQSNIRHKIKRESGFLMCSATERYLDFQKRWPGLERRITQSQLASYLGITPTSLSRIRRALRKEPQE